MTARAAQGGRPRVLVLRHVAVEGPGRIGDALARAGVTSELVAIDRGAPVPRALADFDGLVVMGGPMGVYEAARHPHLRDELALIEHALRRKAPVLGICLGSQLLAAALGARVYPGAREEIGWLDVLVEDAAVHDPIFSPGVTSFRPLHWHGDIFELPRGAIPLAHSALTACQAFRVVDRPALGLLFHLETTPALVVAMADAFADELAEAGVDRLALVEAAARATDALAPIAERVFDRWVASVRAFAVSP